MARARSLQIFAAHCALWFAAVGSLAQLGGTDIAISGQMELSRLIDLASTRLRLNIEYDPAALKGATTFRIEGKISDQELWLLLNRVLAARGFTTVRMPGESAYSVVKLADASNLAGIETLQAGAPPPGFKIAVVRIQHRPVKEIVDAIGKTLSKAGGGSIVPLGEAGLVLLSDLSPRVDQAIELIKSLDTPGPEVLIREIAVRNLSATALAILIAQVSAKRELVSGRKVPGEVLPSPNGSAVLLVAPEEMAHYWEQLIASLDQREQVSMQSYVPTTFALKEVSQLIEQTVRDNPALPPDERFKIVMDDLTGAILITGTPSQHESIKALIDRLNQSTATPARPVRSFVIRNRSVHDVQEVLERLLSAGVIGAESVATTAPSPPKSDVYPWPPPAAAAPSTPGAAGATGQAAPAAGGNTAPPSTVPTTTAKRGTTQDASLQPTLSLTTDNATNTLIVMAEPRVLAQIESLLETLDVRQPQVMLEVLIVSLSQSQTLSLGVELEQIQISSDVRIRLSSLFGLSTPGTGGAGAAGAGFTGSVLSPGDFSILIRALETINSGRSLSMPRLLMANNQQGTLDSTLEIPYASTNASNTVTTTSLGGTKPAGTQVTIKPQIGSADHLTLEYSVSLSSFTGSAANPNLPPPRQENKIQSSATIPDGYTVAVGGIALTTDGTGISQVPFLGRIPILGEAFKNRSKNTSDTRFYVFIRASILRNTSFDDLKYISDRDGAAASVDDGFPEVEPRVIR